MAENKQISDINAKWDDCLDLSLRRVAYSSLGGAFAGLLFFRIPLTRWAAVAFGAGVGLGSAYSDCSQIFNRPSGTSTFTTLPVLLPSQVSNSSISEKERRHSPRIY